MKIRLNNVRLAFPVLWEARAVQDGDTPSFSAAFLFAPDHPAVAAIEAGIETLAKDKWGEKAQTVLKQMRANNRVCLQDGDMKSQYAGYEGNLFVNTRSATRPLVVDQQKRILAASDGIPYAGCYVNATIELWAQANKYGQRINASLGGVQFLRDGDAFGGGRSASIDDFDDVSEGSDAEDLL